MKIILLSYTFWPPNFGGELLIAEERLKELAKRGHQVLVLTAGAEGYPASETVDNLDVHRSPFIGKNKASRILRRIVFWFWSLEKLLGARQVAVVHFNSLPGFEPITANLYGGFVSWVAHLKRARTVYVHSLASEEEEFFKPDFWDCFFFSFIDHLVCVSAGLFQATREKYPTKAVEIICGVRDDIFCPLSSPEKKLIRQRNGIGEADIVFTFLGSIGRRKGFDLIADAFLEAYPQHSNWKLWVIGPRYKSENQNINQNEVEEVIGPLGGLNDNVKFWGRIDDRIALATLIGASDIFLFPSRKEGFGLAPVEAMAAGTPPIVSRIPGVTDLANLEGETGLYVKPGDKEELLSAMKKLAEDQSLRKAMGIKARQRVADAFSWRQHVDRWEQLYLGNLHGE